jgi:hypothetical protein
VRISIDGLGVLENPVGIVGSRTATPPEAMASA